MPFYPNRGGTSWVRGSSSRDSAPNKWKRPRKDDGNPETEQGSPNAIHSSTREGESTSVPMVKRGSYQLVSKTKVDNETMPIDPNPAWVRRSPSRKRRLGGPSAPYPTMLVKGQNKWKATTEVVQHENVTDDKSSTTLVKRGTHQLVLKNKSKKHAVSTGSDAEKGENGRIPSVPHQQWHQETACAKGEETQEPGEKSHRHPIPLKRIGSHKMVLDRRTEHNQDTTREVITLDHGIHDQTKVQNQSPPSRNNNSRHSHGRCASLAKGPKHVQTSFDSFTNGRRMPRRIRLTTTDTNVQEVLESEGQDNNAAEIKDSQERLSKFAYREIGRQGPRRHTNRTLNVGGREEPRKMGLVRVNRTNNAPICPFYAKGMECTDRFCQKRHDVPIESAVPVCSFFQKNGQCLKENCRFRHIKINAQAAVCPTFALLGYCENAGCTMKHIMGASQPTHSSRTIQPRKADTQGDRIRKR